MKILLNKSYEDIISLENLFAAWEEFVPGKRSKKDVQEFAAHLADNIVQLHNDLANFTYRHGGYKQFSITDPKPRQIHKARVRDRVLHHAIYRQLYPFFDRTFIADSFSCRVNKGTHQAMNRFQTFASRVSTNYTRTCWVLKCDIKKFFASVNHQVLLNILSNYIPDKDIVWLVSNVVKSFPADPEKGLPLGNLTSQLFCNVYMNEFDQFVKHKLRVKYYVRYADDFVLLSANKEWLSGQIPKISQFLNTKLKLSLLPDKLYIKTFASGVDFLGWVHFPTHRVIRTSTKKRMMRRIQDHPTNQTLQSYLGLLQHGNAFQQSQEIINWAGLWQSESCH